MTDEKRNVGQQIIQWEIRLALLRLALGLTRRQRSPLSGLGIDHWMYVVVHTRQGVLQSRFVHASPGLTAHVGRRSCP